MGQGKHFVENKKTNKLLTILLIIFIIVFIYSSFTLINWYISTGNSEEKYQELISEVIITEDDYENSTTKIDFTKLKKTNSDCIAWIEIENTNINYPVMQTTDNSYYLTHNFEKNEDKAGALFFDYRNEMTDKNIVIYGHNIKRGTMFSDLKNIYNGELGTNVEINLYTENEMITFYVFSSYCTEPDTYPVDISITEDNFTEFYNSLKQKSEFNFEDGSVEERQILTLSTCDDTGKKRIMVHAIRN